MKTQDGPCFFQTFKLKMSCLFLTSSHKLGNVNQHPFVSPQLHSLGVVAWLIRFLKAEIQVLAGPVVSPEARLVSQGHSGVGRIQLLQL